MVREKTTKKMEHKNCLMTGGKHKKCDKKIMVNVQLCHEKIIAQSVDVSSWCQKEDLAIHFYVPFFLPKLFIILKNYLKIILCLICGAT